MLLLHETDSNVDVNAAEDMELPISSSRGSGEPRCRCCGGCVLLFLRGDNNLEVFDLEKQALIRLTLKNSYIDIIGWPDRDMCNGPLYGGTVCSSDNALPSDHRSRSVRQAGNAGKASRVADVLGLVENASTDDGIECDEITMAAAAATAAAIVWELLLLREVPRFFLCDWFDDDISNMDGDEIKANGEL